jgi:hypothetical protein
MSAASSNDPFTGTWTFNPSKSALSFPAPRSWLQHVQSNAHELMLREDIVLADGTEFTVSLQAGFDGKDYPVAGSRYVDTMAYTRPELRTILGFDKQNGSITRRGTVSVSPAGDSLTILLSLYSGGREFATGTLVFAKS